MLMKRLALITLYTCIALTGIHAQTAQDSVAAPAPTGEEFTDYYKLPEPDDSLYVSKTTFDWTEAAKDIIGDAKTDYQKIRAIYEWICGNIDYDTTYSIFTADECVEQQKGVCQAYCEVFYQLAKAVGVRVEVVGGLAKDSKGHIDDKGHAWVFAYTRENHGMLLDPTWGAGHVADGVFTRSEDCWMWFNVTPEWMILSHLPEKEAYQLLTPAISRQAFEAMSPVDPIWLEYGLDAKEIAQKAISNTLTMPHFFTGGEGDIMLVDMPQQKSLRIGEFYDFRIKMLAKQSASGAKKAQREHSVINGKTYVVAADKDWKDEGNGIYSIRYMPRDTSDVSINLREKDGGKRWSTIVSYAVDAPTADDWARVEQLYPLSIPEVQGVKNLDGDKWAAAGVSGHQLLQLIRRNQVKELPVLFDGKGQKFTIVSVPMNKQLQEGKKYTFCFYPQSGIKWALVNGETWHTDWQVADDGLHTMTITAESGRLVLFVQMKEGESFWSAMEYAVE